MMGIRGVMGWILTNKQKIDIINPQIFFIKNEFYSRAERYYQLS